MKEMTLKEYRQIKEDLKVDIYSLCNEFTKQTGGCIENIYIRPIRNVAGGIMTYTIEIEDKV